MIGWKLASYRRSRMPVGKPQENLRQTNSSNHKKGRGISDQPGSMQRNLPYSKWSYTLLARIFVKSLLISTKIPIVGQTNNEKIRRTAIRLETKHCPQANCTRSMCATETVGMVKFNVTKVAVASRVPDRPIRTSPG